VIARAGILTPADYARRLSGAVNTLTNSPARAFTGAVGMSQQAPFVDAAVSIDPTNRSNTFISYYTYGEALGIALDLTLRARTPRVTLDDYMRALWQEFGRPQTAALAPVRGYTLADAERVLSTVSGDPAFAREFFARYVIGSELPDFPVLLARAGLLVRHARPTAAWFGDTRLSADNAQVIVAGPPTLESPMRALGLSAGDRILTIDGVVIETVEAVRTALAARRPGDEVRATWRGRTGDREGSVRLTADPRVEVLLFEDAGRTLTPQQLAFREAWLRSTR
jgi:predicted metalloprotease with PDZ domain